MHAKDLPVDVLQTVLENCGPRDVVNGMLVGSNWYAAGGRDDLWYRLTLDRYGFAGPDKGLDEGWKGYYVRTLLTKEGWVRGKPRDYKMLPMRGHKDYVVASELRGDLALSASRDGSMRVWRYVYCEEDAGKTACVEGPVYRNAAPLSAMAVSPCATLALIADTKGKLTVVNVETGAMIAASARTNQPNASITSVSLDFDSDLFAAANNEGTFIFDIRAPDKAVHSLRSQGAFYTETCFDKRQQVVTATDSSVLVYDVRSQTKELHDVSISPTAGLTAAVWTPERNDVVVGCDNGVVAVVDSKTGTLTSIKGNGPCITSVAREKGRLAYGEQSGAMGLVTYHGGADTTVHKTQLLSGHTGRINDLTFHGGKLLSAAADGCVQVHSASAASAVPLFALLGGSLQPNPRNPPHPSKPWASAVHCDASKVLVAWNSMLRMYNFSLKAKMHARSAEGDCG